MRATLLAILGALAYALAVTVFLGRPAHSQASNCAARGQVIMRLAEGYGETRQSVAIAASGQVVEMWANIETGSWTLTVTTAQGLTCLVASGESFERIDAPGGEPT